MPDFAAGGLDLQPSGAGVDYEYAVSGMAPTLATGVAFYWAAGGSRAEAIGPPALVRPLGASGTREVSLAALGDRPAGATHLLMVLDPDGRVAETNEDNNVSSVQLSGLVDVRPTGMEWDAVNDRVRLGYQVTGSTLPAGATYNLFWAQGTTKLSGPLLDSANTLDRRVGTWTDFVPGSRLGVPPAGATHLLLEVDAGRTVAESSETNNLLPLSYRPAINGITATFDGDDSDAVIGRFFSGVRVDGQKVEVRVSEELAVVADGLTIRLGNSFLPVTRQPGGDGRTFVTGAFDPGTLSADTMLTVAATGAGPVAEKAVTVAVEPLPAWYGALKERSVTFDDTIVGNYLFDGKLLDVSVGGLLKMPAGVWLGGGQTLGSLAADLRMRVNAGLSPTDAPDLRLRLDVDVEWLGDTVYERSAATSGVAASGPFTADVRLDPRTLAFGSAALRYQESTALAPLTLFGGRTFATQLYRAKSQVTVTPTLVADITLNLDGQGRLAAGSCADVRLDGAVGGSLADVGFNTNPAILTTLQRAARLAGASPPAVLTQAITSLLDSFGLLPTFNVRLDTSGTFRVGGRVALTAAGVGPVTASAAINVTVTGRVLMTFLGSTEEILALPGVFNGEFRIRV